LTYKGEQYAYVSQGRLELSGGIPAQYIDYAGSPEQLAGPSFDFGMATGLGVGISTPIPPWSGPWSGGPYVGLGATIGFSDSQVKRLPKGTPETATALQVIFEQANIDLLHREFGAFAESGAQADEFLLNLYKQTAEAAGVAVGTLGTIANGYKILPSTLEQAAAAQAGGHCFPAGVLISRPDGSSAPIETIRPGDLVSAFDRLGDLVARKVMRLSSNITDTWIELSNGLIVTPGHRFLTPAGAFQSIADILISDNAIVLADGSYLLVTGRYILYSAATAGLFEQAEGFAYDLDGSTALAPEFKRGWRTYNFEVEDLHTYIAGGVRVHNASPQYMFSTDGRPLTEQAALVYDSKSGTRIPEAIYLPAGYTGPVPISTVAFNPAGYASAATGAELFPVAVDRYDADTNTWSEVINFRPAPVQASVSDSTSYSASYQVSDGDTLSQIAEDNGTTVAALMQANPGITDPNKIYTGQTVNIPSSSHQGSSSSGGDSGNVVTTSTGKQVEVGSTYTSGESSSGQPYHYVVNGDGSITNTDTGQVTSHSNVDQNTQKSSWWQQVTSPLLLDIDGNGLKVTEQSSSNMFYDMAGDGKQHQTAWAGAGDGVLVLDTASNGVITERNQVDFTAWDSSAKTDMQALLDVFDTNHDGKLDSGDTDWSLFKVMVTNADGATSLDTLSSLGITSINLVSNNQEIDFADGSKILGTATYTKSDGSTGEAGDASLSYDASGYVVARTITVNADGSTTIDNKADNADGSLANETISTTSADGTSRMIKFDNDGDGVVDRVETIVDVVNADGSITETLKDFDGSGTILSDRRITTTSADLKTVTVDRDSTGSGTYFDQTETDVTEADGSLTVTVTDLNADGSTHDERITSTSVDGLSKTIQTELTGSGTVNATTTDTTSVAGDGTRTETVTIYKGTGTSSAYEVSQTVTSISADGSDHSVASDLDGNGTIDLTTTSTIVHNADGSTTTTTTDSNGDSSLRDEVVTLLSADGNSKTTQTDADGDGTFELTTSDVTVINADGSTTETITKTNAYTAVLSKSVSTWSADGTTRTNDVDRDGDGHYDQIETVAIVGSNSVDTVSTYSPNGATLISKSVTTTSADGLAQTEQSDVNGDGTYDAVQTSTTVINADNSSTVTVIEKNGAGTVQIGKTVTTTSADGLSVTTQTYLDAQTSPYGTTTDVSVLNGDGSTTRTVTTFTGTSLTQIGKTVITTSADRRTSTSSSYLDTNTAPQSVTVSVTNIDGSKTETVSTYSPDGATLISQQTITISADGLTTTTTVDANGDGVVDATTVSATSLNADGSSTKTTTDYAGSATASGNEVDQTSISTSGNGLYVTTQVDSDGDGVIDSRTTDVTALWSDGSRVETITSYSDDAGAHQTGKTVTSTSATGLSKTTSTYLGDDTLVDQTSADVTVLNSDGSKTETDTETSADGSIVLKSTMTTSANGLSATVSTDLDGDGVNDIVKAMNTNTDGSISTATSTYSSTGTLTSKSTLTISASGLSTTTATDLDGNGTTDKSKSDITVLNSDGSKTETISDFTGTSTLVDQTVRTFTADGLSITTQWDDTGSGSFTRSKTDVTTINADGSRTEVVSYLNAGGSLHDKSTTITSADGTNVTVTKDINGDGTVDQTLVTQLNADGSTTISDMDGVVHSASGRLYGGTNGAYETISADGLSRTLQYDGSGDSLAESQRTDVTVLNADGSRSETIADAALSGGSPTSANPVYTVTPTDKEVITTSTNGLSKTTQWDLTGRGTFTESQTDQTAINIDGSRTETVSLFSGPALKSRQASSQSADGLTQTRQVDATGSGTYTQSQTKTTVLNADGTTTITTTASTLGGGEMSLTTETVSADGRTKTFTQDPTGWGNITQSRIESLVTLADGQTVATASNYYGNLGSLKDKTTTTTSGDGRAVSIVRDANGDGVNDQTVVITQAVDGSSSVVTTDLTHSGGVADKSTTTISADGLTISTQTDLNGNGIIDQTVSDVRVNNADGSIKETIQTYQTSHLVSGVETSMSTVLIKSTTSTISADGLTHTITTDVDGNGTTDQTSTTVTKIDGSAVTTVSNNTAARNVAPTPGQVLWSSSLVSTDKTVAASVVITTSADGLGKTVQADYDGNGTYEHTEVWQTEIDGSQIATITDVNASGVAIARGYETISADGLTTALYVDPTASGQISHKDTAVRAVDGSIVETVVDLNSDGTLNKRVVSTISANGQSVAAVTTNGPGTAWSITASSTTPNDYGIDGKATVSGTGNTISFGNAVDVAVLNGNNNTIDETGDAEVTITGSGTGKALHAIDRDNVGSISSATIEIENDSSLTLEGSNNTITVYDNADLLVWSGTGNTLTVDGNGDVATMSASTIQLWNGSSLSLMGGDNQITVYNDTDLATSSAGQTITIAGYNAQVAASSSDLYVWDDNDVTLNGGNDNVTLYNNAKATVTGTGYWVDVLGTGADVTSHAAGTVVKIENGAQATVFDQSNSIEMHDGSLTLADGGNVVTVAESNGYIQGDNNTVNIGYDLQTMVDGTDNTINFTDHDGQVNLVQGGNTVNVGFNYGYVQGDEETINVAQDAQVSVDGTGNDIYLGQDGEVTSSQGGNTVYFQGTNGTATLNSSTANVEDESGGTVDGSNDTINLHNDSWVVLTTSGGTVNVGGTNAYMQGGGQTVNVDTNAMVSVDGTGNEIHLGLDSQAVSMQDGNLADLEAADAYLQMDNGTVNVMNGMGGSVDGSHDAIYMGQNSWVNVIGSYDSLSFLAGGLGDDQVDGFEATGSGADDVYLDHTMFADWSTLLSHATQSGSDVLITENSENTITLHNTNKTDLQQSHFHFV